MAQRGISLFEENENPSFIIYAEKQYDIGKKVHIFETAISKICGILWA